MNHRLRTGSHDQTTIRGAREGRDGALDIARVAHVDREQLHSKRKRSNGCWRRLQRANSYFHLHLVSDADLRQVGQPIIGAVVDIGTTLRDRPPDGSNLKRATKPVGWNRRMSSDRGAEIVSHCGMSAAAECAGLA